ncbi:TPA: acetyl-CoA hydrolase, partial [Clostridioides difficile]|nr:acetyl-CoA hydrolase [Clostridioides difficile]
ETKSFIKKPEWAQEEEFPYLKPQFNIASVFLGDIATMDAYSQYRGYIPMR